MARRQFSGRALRAERRAAGITAEVLASRIGRSVSAVSAWERGLREPAVGAALAVADALEVPLEQLLADELAGAA